MTGRRVALDLAILLPAPLLQSCVRINATLRPPPEGFHFDDTHLPHVSLVQQFVLAEAVDPIVEQVAATLRLVAPLRLQPSRLGGGRVTSVLHLARTTRLIRLHRALMNGLAPFETPGGSTEDFAPGPERARASDVRWVQRFRTDAAYERFDPHITLGVGRVASWPGPTRARAVEMALCQLGRFCTCRHVLARWTLTPRNP